MSRVSPSTPKVKTMSKTYTLRDIKQAFVDVFDDGGDGADAESARGVVLLLNKLLAKTDEQDQGHE